MGKSIPLEVKYNKDTRPAWTMRTVINYKASYIKQMSDPCLVAKFILTLEPYLGNYPVVFCYNTALQDSLADRYKQCLKFFEHYAQTVMKTIIDDLNERYETGKTIMDVRFTVSDLLIHPVDSRDLAYQKATKLALNEILTDENLFQL